MKIYRRRFIPDEIVDISTDEVVYEDEKMLVTKWFPIKPRVDVGRGVSYTLFEKGWKISKFYDTNGMFIFWYCDIIEHEKIDDGYILKDLLVDVKVYEDGSYEVLDEEELEVAYEQDLITEKQKEDAIGKLNELVELIKNKKFPLEEILKINIE